MSRRAAAGAADAPPDHAPPPEAVPPRPRRWGRRLAWGLALALVGTVPWWGRTLLRRLDFFHVRTVEVLGTRYLDPADVVRELAVDTLQSVWDPLAPLEARVALLPQVREVRVQRRLPGTLVVRLEEREPVAFVAAPTGLRAHDAEGRALPIDPSRTRIDLPILAEPDTGLLRLLDEVRVAEPAFYRRVSELRRVGPDEIVFRLFTTSVRARPTVSASRLADIHPVEADLARRRVRAAELDLRFRDQVIARLP
jgi:cell division protein FtsQ